MKRKGTRRGGGGHGACVRKKLKIEDLFLDDNDDGECVAPSSGGAKVVASEGSRVDAAVQALPVRYVGC